MEFEECGRIGMGPRYDSTENSNSTGRKIPATPRSVEVELIEGPMPMTMMMSHYYECQRNHAVNLGGYAVDGCGEFLPANEDALKCAACNCHRNFHRKETHPSVTATATATIGDQYPNQQQHNNPSMNLRHPQGFPSLSSGISNLNISNESKKRHRTKFTLEQKEIMKEMAEKLGWQIKKQDKEFAEQLCNNYGLERHVFKVWMRNNKSSYAK